ncbi:hypothetical protein JW921_07710 [Candidatus Fermentibacterales bacterium]|nr:hypothetical protein [Candidatus Fermentibacterales bacterium]
MRKVLLAPVLAVLLVSACLEDPVGVTPSSPQSSVFLTVWEEFEQYYPEFTSKGIDWELCYGKYLPMAEQAGTDEELMLGVVLPMLAELRDCHVWMTSPTDDFYYTWEPEIEENFDIVLLLNRYLFPNGFTGWDRGVGYCMPDRLPYLSINIWVADLNLERIDEFIELAKDCPAIILDVRMNPGGNNILCGEAAGRFAGETVLGWFARFRNGPDYDDCEYYEVLTSPEGPAEYSGTVILLIGEYSASSSEDFACSMMNLPNVVMIGDTTMGAGCCPYWVRLPNRWEVTAVSWSTRTADDVPVEWLGIAPDIYVEATEEHFGQGFDPVMVYAMDMVENAGRRRGAGQRPVSPVESSIAR